MSRLNNSIRDEIIKKALGASFDKKFEKMKKEEQRIALKLYKASFKPSVLKSANEMPENWFRKDSCLRFNCGGYNIRLCIPDPGVVVPYSSGCGTIGSFAADEEMGKLGMEFVEKKRDLDKEREEAKYKLRAVIYSVQTIKKLKEAWPQGIEFYKEFEEIEAVAGVPALRIEELNKALGIAA